ncbi:MAG: hypothetical protein H0T69_19610, partial [Thermoleophilaceae bacterium]|nr:hypothetical protein [Thermoleophilaceae bacterium]
MTDLAPTIAAFLAAGVVAAGGLLAGDADGRAGSAPRTALVIDAAAGRDGRELLDSRLRDVDAEVRLPRTSAEALTNVRYFAAQDYRMVVMGPRSGAAARAAGVPAVRAPD